MSLYDNIAEFYDEIFPLKETRLSFVDSFLSKNDLTVLDIGCATGELALALSRKGHHVMGIDLDGKMVKLARQKTKKTGLKAEFFIKDMAKIGIDFPSAYFDVVLCLGNTLVHLESLKKIEQFLIAIGKVLKMGGMVIIQIVNYDRILSDGIKELPLLENEKFIFRREYHDNGAAHLIHFLTYLTLKESGQVIKNSETLYPLTFRELNHALMDAGFSDFQFFGNENKTAYEKKSPALIVIGKKVD
ncbi:MAG: methyltransferase domain-containing protein [Candidatus Aminicenantes bacterium]|nr:methyltransferase domain-containing protein [Candidatus Aminicenantes bacterium]NIM83529.1 methyltransferase domain-containing protein [Candidatus Aminicenantes bacterium]NIN22918.1 methyltransferase domain-containing protein [Candidatus Aminicenantes bacterium]NIN46657.1 methyltransferase domain-containing protein [Candidatus Aminicenantes bacterium]NIN89563.1 methyltransferase domain-containing protein [Candidatus Aminicenantes bacterium]